MHQHPMACIEKDNCLELQLTIMSLRVLQNMIMGLCMKLKICVWAVSIFLISGLVQYMFIKTYNIYNPHWVDWAHQKEVVTIVEQQTPEPTTEKAQQVDVIEHHEAYRKLKFPSLEENSYRLYVGNFIAREKLGITISTPGIKHEEYFLRRHNLMRVLSQTEYGKQFDNHVVLLSASTLKTMSNDIPYPFHQDVDFLYLSGVNEPDALLALEYNKSSERTNFILFVKPTDPKHELWSGPVIGESAAVAYFKADEGFPLNEFNSVITERYGRGSFCVWYKRTDKGHTRNDSIILNLINSTDFKKAGQHAIEYNIQLLRVIKSDAEARIMKKSASIASQAFAKVMRNTKSGVPESHLHALLDFECRTKGAQHLSFPPVVAGGARANTLHYINNTDLLKSGDLVLMDGGCEFNAYSSDITRSWPVNGKFTTPQKELYEIVLDVQKTCLKACKPGVSLNQLYDTMLSALGKHLQDIGFISKSKTERQVKEITTDYCPHHLGHYLGMDTHDTPLLHRGLPLQPGMAFTLEPGLYIPKYARHVPERYRGIGIRIEDDILLTNDGPYVLTAELPKEVDDIETLLASGGKT